jgi:hypothetical protein
MQDETCGTCGGDGRIGNSLGGTTATCPSCHGSGRRAEWAPSFHDVTKTKPSHHHPVAAVPAGPKVPMTPEGIQLAREIAASTTLDQEGKRRMTAEIVAHETTHGRCTQTFLKKARKQLKPAT